MDRVVKDIPEDYPGHHGEWALALLLAVDLADTPEEAMDAVAYFDAMNPRNFLFPEERLFPKSKYRDEHCEADSPHRESH